MKTRTIARVAVIITSISLVMGLLFYVGSIHSGGPAFYASMYIVPPLYLDYKGYIPIDSLFSFVAIMALLQFVLVLLLVVIYSSIRTKIEGTSEKTRQST